VIAAAVAAAVQIAAAADCADDEISRLRAAFAEACRSPVENAGAVAELFRPAWRGDFELVVVQVGSVPLGDGSTATRLVVQYAIGDGGRVLRGRMEGAIGAR
jgi:hypothetical protein